MDEPCWRCRQNGGHEPWCPAGTAERRAAELRTVTESEAREQARAAIAVGCYEIPENHKSNRRRARR